MKRPAVNEAEVRRWCVDRLAKMTGLPAATIDPQAKFSELGLDSATAVTFILHIEDWLEIELTPEIVYEYPSVDALAKFLVHGAATTS